MSLNQIQSTSLEQPPRYVAGLSDVQLLNRLQEPIDPMLNSSFKFPECRNIVSNVEWGIEVDLQGITQCYACPEYTPKKFAAVKLRIRRPSTTALIFMNGSVVCVGAVTQESARLACHKHRRLISQLGYETRFDKFCIQNRVYTASVPHSIDLAVINKNPELIEEGNRLGSRYLPDSFPGLIYSLKSPPMKLTIFDSGKVTMTGVERPEHAVRAWNHLYTVLGNLRDDNRPIQSDDRFAYRMGQMLRQDENDELLDYAVEEMEMEMEM